MERQRKARRPGTAWTGEVARWYESLIGEEGSGFHRDLIFPQTLRLLELKEGERVLDLACGEGAFCRVLHKLGVQAVGLDASRDLIRYARRKSDRGIRYLVGDAQKLGEVFGAGEFDAIACLLAIQNIDPLGPVFAGCQRVLRPGGRLVLVMTHPCFRVPRQSGWGWDAERKLLYRRIDRYLSPLKVPIQVHPGSAPGIVSWSFHRPLQSYVNGLAQTGLCITALEEWPSHHVSGPGPRARAENRARAEVPLFLALRAHQPDSRPAQEMG